MKKRLTAILLSTVLAFAPVVSVYADETAEAPVEDSSSESTETPTEEVKKEPETEAPTKAPEKATEAPTKAPEKATEAPTKAPEKATETTTKAPSNSSNNSSKSDTITKTKDVEVGVDDTLNLYKYVDDSYSANDYDWYSDSKSYATVSSKGVVTGKKRGSATVTATYSSGNTKREYTFNVEISSSGSSSSSGKKISIDVGDTKDLYSYVDDDYDARDYDWDSNSSCVTVTLKGVIKGVREGTAKITATYDEDDEDLEYTFNVTVGDGDSSSSSSSSSSSKIKAKTSWEFYLDKGDEVDVSAILEDDPDEYDWDSDDEDIATYDEDEGVISAEDEGEARIRARGDEDYTFRINVDNDYTFKEITIDGDDEEELERYLDYDVDEYDFSSDRTDVVTVSRKGIATGKANGIATILCEHEDGDITQIMVEVKGIKATTTTKETTTEATTAKPVSKPVSDPFSAVSFTDISHRAWAINAINSMASKGIIAGVGNNKFSPDANCKRCDFVIVLTKILGVDGDIAAENFSDVAKDSYYYNYVGIAKSLGIDAGVKNDKFRPDDYITREEIMVMVYQGLSSKGVEMNTDTSVLVNYSDSIEVSAADEEAVAALINGGYVTGTSATTLEPSANITRAQMAVLMDNVYSKLYN